jgi:hypothetical protein
MRTRSSGQVTLGCRQGNGGRAKVPTTICVASGGHESLPNSALPWTNALAANGITRASQGQLHQGIASAGRPVQTQCPKGTFTITPSYNGRRTVQLVL